jgi:hypothetical protein
MSGLIIPAGPLLVHGANVGLILLSTVPAFLHMQGRQGHLHSTLELISCWNTHVISIQAPTVHPI